MTSLLAQNIWSDDRLNEGFQVYERPNVAQSLLTCGCVVGGEVDLTSPQPPICTCNPSFSAFVLKASISSLGISFRTG